MAVASLASGAAAAALGTLRGLPVQDLTVDVAQAARHLFPQVNWAPRLEGRALPAAHDAHRALLLGIYRTRDGRHFVPCALSQHERNAWGRLLGVPPTAEALGAAIAARDGAWLEARAARAGLSGTCCRTAAAWAAHPHGRHLAARPVVGLEPLADASCRAGRGRDGGGVPLAEAQAGWGRWTRPEDAPAGDGPRAWGGRVAASAEAGRGRTGRPLQGLRVLVFGRAFAGPLVGRALAAQGAEVLHVGNPAAPEAPAVYAEGYLGGRSAAADLRCPETLARVHALATTADVVVDNGRAGVAARFGLGPAQLARLRPGGVHVRIDAFGEDGPWGGRPGYDMNACAAAGLMRPSEGGPPRHVASLLLCDFVAGELGAAGACAALVRQMRARGAPPGQQVRVVLAQIASWCLALGPAPGHALAGPTSCPIPRTQTFDTPLGALRRLWPAVTWSHTPGGWRAPVLAPQGSAALAWIGPGRSG